MGGLILGVNTLYMLFCFFKLLALVGKGLTGKLASPKQERVMEGVQAADCLISSYKQSLPCAKRKFIVMHAHGGELLQSRQGWKLFLEYLDNFIELPNVHE